MLGLVTIAFASSVLWSVYIPNQGKSGMVSTINGFLDFSGYAASAVANLIFSLSIDIIGWNGISIIWVLQMALGTAVALFNKKKEDEND